MNFFKKSVFLRTFLFWLLIWFWFLFFLNFFLPPFYTNVANKKIICTTDNCLGNVYNASKNKLIDNNVLDKLNLTLDQNKNLIRKDKNKEYLLIHKFLPIKTNLFSYNLSFYYYKNPIPTNNWIIFVHGISSDWTTSFLYSQFAYKNYNVIIYDSQGVDKNVKDSLGNYGSGGLDFPTFGTYEQFDLDGIVTWIYNNYGGSSQKVGLFGLSMGAATSLIFIKNFFDKYKNIIKFVFSDASYSNTIKQMEQVLKNIFPLPSFFIIPGSALYMNLFYNYNPYKINPIDNLDKKNLPIISFIHGSSDNFVPFQNFNNLFKTYWSFLYRPKIWNDDQLKYTNFIEYGAGHAKDLFWNNKNKNKFFNFLTKASASFFEI